MHKSRALIRPPRQTSRVTRTYIVGNGTPYAFKTRTLRFNRGTCPYATLDHPHDVGTSPDTCDYCWGVTQ